MTTNYREELEKRWDRLCKAEKDTELQALFLEVCKRDPIAWVNNWCYTYDPRRPTKTFPLILFPRQEEYLRWRIELRKGKRSGLTEKSRDSGITWVNVCHQVHCWLFEDEFKGSFGSRKEELVDRLGDPDSIFEKIRILLRNIPKWMLPKDFNWSEHDNFRRLINPSNGSTITGEAGDNIGRGGRSSIYDLDEAAFIERPESVEAALSGNTDSIFYTSTVNGHNFFYKKRSQLPPECVFTFHWRNDPRKNDDWYKIQCEKFDPVIVASEIDIDYGASVEGIYIGNALVMSAVNLELPAKGKIYAALDVATTGRNLNTFGVRQGSRVIAIEHWSGLDTTQTAYKVVDLCKQYGVYHLAFDADGVGAGVAGTLNAIPGLSFLYTPLHGSDRPSDTYWEAEDRSSKEKYLNYRAEMWGILKWRFKNTFDHINGINFHGHEDMISIPNHPTLIQQISQPTWKMTAAGKVQIESKVDMKKRGLESPDFADMLAYLFAPVDAGMWGNL